MKEVDSSLLVRLHRSIKVTLKHKIAHARLTCLCLFILGEQKGESVVTENPKGGIAENFGRIHRGTTQICSKNEDEGGGENAEVIKSD